MACRQVKAKSQLNRLGRADGNVVLDPRPVFGRTAYLCSAEACWAAAEKRRLIDRALQVRLTAGDWARLRQGILT